MVAPVMVTKPIRGSRISCRRRRETSARIRSDTESGRLPEVLMLDLRNGDVVVLAQPILEAGEHLPFFFQRGHAGEVHLNDAQTDIKREIVLRRSRHRSEALHRDLLDLERLD